jgi:transcription initiation factor TFIIIB Brf1 subunit/transcription initiation factor TFIIB
MALKFTLSEMQATLENATNQTNKYSEAINTIEETINKLSASWVSKEIGTYEEFVNRYNEKKRRLFDARDYMIRFCDKLREKISEFDEAATAIKNSFE